MTARSGTRKGSNVWEADYLHDRRKHRHRCLACWRAINDGERVVMVRLRRLTKAVHHGCADSTVDSMTWRQRFEAWAAE